MSNKNISGIYKITNNINGKIYIGCSKDIKNRWNTHKQAKSKKSVIHLAIQKYGVDNFTFEVLLQCPNICFDYWEKRFISEYACVVPNGYNLTHGGNYKIIFSEETKQKMSEIKKGHTNMLGKTHSIETKAKIGEKSKNRITPELKQKMFAGRIKTYEYNCLTFRGLQQLADYIGCTYTVAFRHYKNQTLPIINLGKKYVS